MFLHKNNEKNGEKPYPWSWKAIFGVCLRGGNLPLDVLCKTFLEKSYPDMLLCPINILYLSDELNVIFLV